MYRLGDGWFRTGRSDDVGIENVALYEQFSLGDVDIHKLLPPCIVGVRTPVLTTLQCLLNFLSFVQ